MKYPGLSRPHLQFMEQEVARQESVLADTSGHGESLPRARNRKTCQGIVKRRFCRVFGAKSLGEKGFALVYAVVLFGVLAIALSSAVSQEGSAQALNIRTGQRRKALDLARGVVDEMLEALFTHGFDLSKCPNYSYGSHTSTIMREDPQKKWTATATAGKDSYGFIRIAGEARVVGVSETVEVKLEPYSILDLYADGVGVAGNDLELEFKNKSAGLEIFGNVYAGNEVSIDETNDNVRVYGDVCEEHPVQVPTPEDVKRQVDAALDPKLNETFWYELNDNGNDIVIGDDTKVSKTLSVSVRNLTVEPDAWLHVQGNLVAGGHSQVQIDGVVVVDGHVTCNGQANIRVDGVLIVREGHINIGNAAISGSGAVICLSEDQKFKINLGEGEMGGLCLVSLGELELTISDASQATNSLFVYAREIKAVFEGSEGVSINPCRFVAAESMEIEFKNNAGLVQLHAGDFDWYDHTPFFGKAYRIVDWTEGKTR